MKKVTVNKEQKLYVLPCGNGGFSCLGFDVVQDRKEKLAKEFNVTLQPHRKGSLASYNEYQRLIKKAFALNKATGWKSKSELIPEFIGREGERVEIVDKYGEKRRFYIGKSTGFIPAHLEILKSNSTGGGIVTGYPFQKLTFLDSPL